MAERVGRESLTPVPGEDLYSNPASVSSSSQDYCNSPIPSEGSQTPHLTQKGIEQAKKRLRAFSIQKKLPSVPRSVPVKTPSGSQTVVIGKVTSIKPAPKSVVDPDTDERKMPKPPKPGCKIVQESYLHMQQRTLSEIENMKRKIELAELGIPLGLLAPDTSSDRAMPTGAMPPMKSFLTPAQLDEILVEAKKAKEEGKSYKFNYKKMFPNYDNPFMRKSNTSEKKEEKKSSPKRQHQGTSRQDYRKDQRPDRKDYYNKYKHYDDKDKRPSKYRPRLNRDRYRERTGHRSTVNNKKDLKVDSKDKVISNKHEVVENKNAEGVENENEVIMDEYLVCDSWSIEKDDIKADFDHDSAKCDKSINEQVSEIINDKKVNKKEKIEKKTEEPSPKDKENVKVVPKIKIRPVSDALSYEISEIDIFDEKADLESFAVPTVRKDNSDTEMSVLEDSQNMSDSFLESVINEIKDFSGDYMNEKRLIDYDSPGDLKLTPELKGDDRKSMESCKSVESGYRSTDSAYRSTDSTYRSTDSTYKVDKDNLNEMSKATIDSLETWTFVLKICQPLLFRHDDSACFRSTITRPMVRYSMNTRICTCVRDRTLVYEELDSTKMALVDRLYGCDQIPESPIQCQRTWYPKFDQCLSETSFIPLSSSWEDDSSQASETMINKKDQKETKDVEKEGDDISLDKAYHRFIDAVRTSISKSPLDVDRSRGHTPTENQKKKSQAKKKDDKKGKKKSEKIEVEDWSQESEVEDVPKSIKKKKNRKRKHSSSSSDSSDSEESSPKKRKSKVKSKQSKKSKSRHRKRKLEEKKRKEKRNKKKKANVDKEEKSGKKSKKKIKAKRKLKEKRRRRSYSSSSDSSSSESSTEREESPTNKTSFDVNILNNIKTERLTDDERVQIKDFSPRRRPQKEIINMRELQCNLVAIKQEANEEERKNERKGNLYQKEIRKDVEKEVGRDVEQEVRKDVEKEVKRDIEKEGGKEVNKDSGRVLEKEDTKKTDKEDKREVEKKVVIEDKKEVRKYDEKELRNEAVKEVGMVVDKVDRKENLEKERRKEVLEDTKIQKEVLKVIKRPPEPVPPPDISQIINTQDFIAKPIEKASFDEEYFGQSHHDLNEYEYRQSYDGFDGSYFAKNDEQDSTGNPIEVVNLSGSRGEIKCDWRAGVDGPRHNNTKPSRWGLKPSDANIVLTGNNTTDEVYPIKSVLDTTNNTYKIETISTTRIKDNIDTGYDEAYLRTYGESDLLQYGDCFKEPIPAVEPVPPVEKPTKPARLSLDDRIDKVLRDSAAENQEKENIVPEHDSNRGVPKIARANKRVSFADGYKPGQDSDTEKPPKKRTRVLRRGCSWPCPADHPDHVPLWDALPPPPPPSEPYPAVLLAHNNTIMHNFDARSLPGVIPPEVLPNIMPYP